MGFWREVHSCQLSFTSLSHDPVAKISGCCNVECDTGFHLVLLIFWDTYLAFILSILTTNLSTSFNFFFQTLACCSLMVRRRLLNEEERHYGGPNETYMGKADEKNRPPVQQRHSADWCRYIHKILTKIKVYK